MQNPASDRDPLDFIESQLLASAIVKLRRARRGVVRHRRGFFESTAVLEVGGDSRRPEAVVAELGFDPGRRGAPGDHRIGVRLRQHSARQLPHAPADRVKQRAFRMRAPKSRGSGVGDPRAYAGRSTRRINLLKGTVADSSQPAYSDPRLLGALPIKGSAHEADCIPLTEYIPIFRVPEYSELSIRLVMRR